MHSEDDPDRALERMGDELEERKQRLDDQLDEARDLLADRAAEARRLGEEKELDSSNSPSSPRAKRRTTSGSSRCSIGRSRSWTASRVASPAISTCSWARIGPVSTPSSTRCTVTPLTVAPAATVSSIG